MEILKQGGATPEAEREQRRHLCKDGGRACVRQCEPRLLPPRWCLGRRNVKRRSLSELDAHVDFFTRAVSPIWLHSSFRGGFVVAYDDGPPHSLCNVGARCVGARRVAGSVTHADLESTLSH